MSSGTLAEYLSGRATAYGGSTQEVMERVAGTYDPKTKPFTKYPEPFTGHGFTADGSHLIPEYKNVVPIDMQDGAELITLMPDGTEQLVAVFREDLGAFVPIGKRG